MTEENPDKKPTGRPSSFTPEIGDRICERLADGISLRTICLDDDMPNKSTVFRWLRQNEEFRDQYARAKQESSDALIEEIIDIADDGSNDWMEIRDKKGNIEIVLDKEHVQRSRLRIDTRKWVASKLKPKVYGEGSVVAKLQALDASGNPTDLPAVASVEATAAAVLAAMAKAKEQVPCDDEDEGDDE